MRPAGAQVTARLECGDPPPEGPFTPQENKEVTDFLQQCPRPLPHVRFQLSNFCVCIRKTIIRKEKTFQNFGGGGSKETPLEIHVSL